MPFEIEEKDDVVMPRAETIILLAKAAGKSIGEIILENVRRVKHEEFWADPCWAEP